MALKEFFKPDKGKVILTVLLLIATLFMTFKLMSTGLTNTLIPVVMILGIFLVFLFGLGGVGAVIGLIINTLWLYLFACILMKIILLIKKLLSLINWTSRKLIVLGVIVVLAIGAYAFYDFGGSDYFIKTADDSNATVQGVQDVANSNNQFAINLYKEINEPGENVFFSPWSISSAVVMVYEGAEGDTAKEIEKVFYFPEDDLTRRSAYAKTLNNLNKAGGKYEMSVANAIWLQEDYPFLQEYKDTVSTYYLGEVKNLDFVNDPSGASSEINKWVSKNTQNKIKKIVNPGMFDIRSRAVLTNAIYFKGKWVNKFDKDDTKDEDFTLGSKSKVKVPLMRLKDKELKFNYTETDGVQILEMPYQGDKISMLVMLPRLELDPRYEQMYQMRGEEPKTATLADLEYMLSTEKLEEWRSNMKSETVYIYMPKYTFETTYSLSDHLKAMGMNTSFTWPEADFSGMDGTQDLYISDAIHKAYIDVYEEGTEAAAVTVFSFAAGSAMPMYKEFRADHPFMFIIQEKETGNILFMGKVNDPRR